MLYRPDGLFTGQTVWWPHRVVKVGHPSASFDSGGPQAAFARAVSSVATAAFSASATHAATASWREAT